jgi:hypothetical protein
MRCVQSSPPLGCLSEPLTADRRRHQELEKTLLEVAPGCDAKHTFCRRAALEAALCVPLGAAQIQGLTQRCF